MVARLEETRRMFVSRLQADLGDALSGIVLFGGQVQSQDETRYRDIDLLVLLSNISQDVMRQISTTLTSLHRDVPGIRDHLAHPPIVISETTELMLNPFLARLITDYGIVWFETNRLRGFLSRLGRWADDRRVDSAAYLLASDSVFFMGQYAFPHGQFLDGARLQLYFAHHFFRWFQTAIWGTNRVLCATKEESIASASSILPEIAARCPTVQSVYDLVASEDGRQSCFCSIQKKHDAIWEGYCD